MDKEFNDSPDTGLDLDTSEQLESEADSQEEIKIENPKALVSAFEKTKNRLQEARRANEELQKKYNELQSKIEGIDPEEYQRLREMQETAEREKLRREKKYEELTKGLEERLKAKEKALSEITTQLRDIEIDRRLQDAFFKAGGRDSNCFNAIAPHLRKLATFDPETKEFSMTFRDLSRLNADGNPATPEEIIMKDFRDDDVFAAFFAPDNTHSGAGVLGGKAPMSQSVRDKLKNIKDPVERRRLARQYGLD